MKIVVLDNFVLNQSSEAPDFLREFGEVVSYERTPDEMIVERCKDADAVVTNKVPFTKETIAQLPNLRYIAVAATGYNIIDCRAAAQAGIYVSNIPAYSTDSVAQMVFAFLLNITNQVQHYAEENRNMRWSNCHDFCYWDTPWNELSGKVMGVVGLGNIGMKVASIAHSFGMKVVAITSKSYLPEYIKPVSKEVLFRTSDVISLHCPLTDNTRDMINAESIAIMKSKVIVINTGRGALVTDQAMAEALNEGRVGAYCADVMREEPPQSDNPLITAPNCYLTPHIAWASVEARKRLMNVMSENFRTFLNGKPINIVNK